MFNSGKGCNGAPILIGDYFWSGLSFKTFPIDLPILEYLEFKILFYPLECVVYIVENIFCGFEKLALT